MRQRSKTGGKAIKTQRRKAFAPKATRGRGSPASGKETNIARLTRERDEALEQQTATSDILRVISGSRGELELVFNAMLENATRICGAKFGTLMLREGDVFRIVSMHGAPKTYVEERQRDPIIVTRPQQRHLSVRSQQSGRSRCRRYLEGSAVFECAYRLYRLAVCKALRRTDSARRSHA